MASRGDSFPFSFSLCLLTVKFTMLGRHQTTAAKSLILLMLPVLVHEDERKHNSGA
jgi:hypothetical protein